MAEQITKPELEFRPELSLEAKRVLAFELKRLTDNLTLLQRRIIDLPYRNIAIKLFMEFVLLCGCIYAVALPYLAAGRTLRFAPFYDSLAVLATLVVSSWMYVTLGTLRVIHTQMQYLHYLHLKGKQALARGHQLLKQK